MLMDFEWMNEVQIYLLSFIIIIYSLLYIYLFKQTNNSLPIWSKFWDFGILVKNLGLGIG